MFKNHPKGLLPAALANMGERFGFYIMMAILSLFLMSKYGLDEVSAGWIYSTFYFSIYILAFVGGIIADKTTKYKTTIFVGLVVMSLGYLLIALPTSTPASKDVLFSFLGIGFSSYTLTLLLTCFGLFTIAFGNGLFKGNLQAVVGQMYDDPKYEKYRDSGFSLFYMFINVGAIFAPWAATSMRNWWVNSNGFKYDAALPDLCYGQINGNLSGESAVKFQELASEVSLNGTPSDLTAFASEYLNVFNTGFHYAFAIAIIAMAISLVIYISNRKLFPSPRSKNAPAGTKITPEIVMEAKEVKQRIWALIAVYGVVIFFWFSFHQNGLTLTYFAKDYTLLKIGKWDISAEIFQTMNPFFVVVLTPLVLAFFARLRAKGKEPSAPGKIAIGMGIAAFAFVVMVIGSLGLPTLSEVNEMGGLDDSMKVTPYLLVITYFILTVAELFISPLGISFVSKVAPPQYAGIMQGGWLGATALGNQLLIIGAIFYKHLPMSVTWALFITVCVISMVTMFAMLAWLNRITGEAANK